MQASELIIKFWQTWERVRLIPVRYRRVPDRSAVQTRLPSQRFWLFSNFWGKRLAERHLPPWVARREWIRKPRRQQNSRPAPRINRLTIKERRKQNWAPDSFYKSRHVFWQAVFVSIENTASNQNPLGEKAYHFNHCERDFKLQSLIFYPLAANSNNMSKADGATALE